MKKITILILAAAVMTFTSCTLLAEALLLSKGKDAKIIAHVIDTEGNPVPDATITAYFRFIDAGIMNTKVFTTDRNGRATICGRCVDSVNFYITKDGWYRGNGGQYLLSGGEKLPEPPYKNGKWLPYGEEQTIVLKKIIEPVPMITSSDWILNYNMPELDKDYGWDMEYNDFVSPYGKGKVADFYVKRTWECDKDIGVKKSFTISFPNCLDGYYIIDRDPSSELTTPQKADVDAKYEKILTLRMEWGMSSKDDPFFRPPYIYCGKEFNHSLVDSLVEEFPNNKALIMRTRSKVDENGTLISAHYSTYFGPILLRETMNEEIHSYGKTFFNPYENNTSLEYDEDKTDEYERKMREKP